MAATKIDMILLTIIPVVFFSTVLLQSDSFWSNLPLTITAISALVTVLFTGIGTLFAILAKIKAEKAVKKVDDLHTMINSGLTVQIQAATDAGITTGILQEKDSQKIRQGDVDKGKLEAIEQNKKEEVLKNMPPPQKEIPSVEKVADKAVKKVVETVITEKDHTLKKKP